MLRSVVVVGASIGGIAAVESLRHAGFDGALALVDIDEELPYDRPPLSKQVLQGVWEPARAALRDPLHYKRLEIDMHLGRRATGVDLNRRHVSLEGGGPLGFDALVLATGASPRHLDSTRGLAGIFTLRTLADCLAIRAAFARNPRVVIVGAGFIGAEVAASARHHELDVTLIEALPVPLSRVVGEEIGARCARLHVDNGVRLRCGVGVDGFVGERRVEGVLLTDGSIVPADLVVVGVGVSPNTDWLLSSGLEIRDGIVCDAYCAASIEGVYAVGDVARWFNPVFGEEMRVEHWTNAGEQGRVAAMNIVAAPADRQQYRSVPYFWSDQYDTKYQFVGHRGPADELRIVYEDPSRGRFVALYGRSGALTAAMVANWPKATVTYRQLIAARTRWDDALEYSI